MGRTTRLKSRISRREALGLIGGAAFAVVVGCGDDDSPATQKATATQTPSRAATASPTASAAATAAAPVACVLTLEQTEGPYFVDERLNRSDLTSDPSNGTVKGRRPASA